MKDSFDEIYLGKTVFLTGHTGFKGAWLAIWLLELGANVVGYSLEPSEISIFNLAHLENNLTHFIGDIRDYNSLKNAIDLHQPDIIFHLAAQPLVLSSFAQPRETFDVNVMGSINILEATKFCPSVQAVVIITTDKVYENKEWLWGYRENDSLGGNDPYSASKAMAELAVTSYTKSFFNVSASTNAPAIATVRAGNVIGGGDFAEFRIVPDCIKALQHNQPIQVRNPNSVRPWLNVLDPLSGYLWLGAKLLQEKHSFTGAWNFGPLENQAICVQELVEKIIDLWGTGDWINTSEPNAKPEMGLLRLNWDKAANYLNWQPNYNWVEALQETVDWFKEYNDVKQDMKLVCVQHIQNFTVQAKQKKMEWALSQQLQESILTCR